MLHLIDPVDKVGEVKCDVLYEVTQILRIFLHFLRDPSQSILKLLPQMESVRSFSLY